MSEPLVLASGSATRASILTGAGVPFTVDKANVDEDSVKASSQQAGLSAGDVAEALATLKAERVSARHPGALVMGADQMLDCEGRWYDKPADRAAAAEQLMSLRGKTHQLISAVVIVLNGTRIWHVRETADLTIRPFSEAFLNRYLDDVGDAVTGSVGGYQLEGLGAQFFAQIKGDYFAILGLPLMPTLDFLRTRGVLQR